MLDTVFWPRLYQLLSVGLQFPIFREEEGYNLKDFAPRRAVARILGAKHSKWH